MQDGRKTDIDNAGKARRATSTTTTWKTIPKTNEVGSVAALLTGAAGVDYDYQTGDTWACYTEHHQHGGSCTMVQAHRGRWGSNMVAHATELGYRTGVVNYDGKQGLAHGARSARGQQIFVSVHSAAGTCRNVIGFLYGIW